MSSRSPTITRSRLLAGLGTVKDAFRKVPGLHYPGDEAVLGALRAVEGDPVGAIRLISAERCQQLLSEIDDRVRSGSYPRKPAASSKRSAQGRKSYNDASSEAWSTTRAGTSSAYDDVLLLSPGKSASNVAASAKTPFGHSSNIQETGGDADADADAEKKPAANKSTPAPNLDAVEGSPSEESSDDDDSDDDEEPTSVIKVKVAVAGKPVEAKFCTASLSSGVVANICTADEAGLSDYERLRLRNIRRNEARLASLGLLGQNGAASSSILRRPPGAAGGPGARPKTSRKKKQPSAPLKRRELPRRECKDAPTSLVGADTAAASKPRPSRKREREAVPAGSADGGAAGPARKKKYHTKAARLAAENGGVEADWVTWRVGGVEKFVKDMTDEELLANADSFTHKPLNAALRKKGWKQAQSGEMEEGRERLRTGLLGGDVDSGFKAEERSSATAALYVAGTGGFAKHNSIIQEENGGTRFYRFCVETLGVGGIVGGRNGDMIALPPTPAGKGVSIPTMVATELGILDRVDSEGNTHSAASNLKNVAQNQFNLVLVAKCKEEDGRLFGRRWPGDLGEGEMWDYKPLVFRHPDLPALLQRMKEEFGSDLPERSRGSMRKLSDAEKARAAAPRTS